MDSTQTRNSLISLPAQGLPAAPECQEFPETMMRWFTQPQFRNGLVLITLATGFAAPVQAEYSLLAGEFDGGEARISTDYSCSKPLTGDRYQAIGFSVAVSGSYFIWDAFSSWDWWDGDLPGSGLDVQIGVYTGPPDRPAELQAVPDSSPEPGLELQKDTAYVLLVQLPCYLPDREAGGWAVVFDGAGAVLSEARRAIPAISMGQIPADAPKSKGRCGEKLQNLEVPYHQTGPFRVSTSGRYYFSDARVSGAMNSCQAVYAAPLNPGNVESNLVGSDYGTGYYGVQHYDQWEVDLEANTDYWLVVQPAPGLTTSGDYFVVVAPPMPLRINPGMTGLWADINTPGQGMYLDVFNSIDQVFMAWFTYDLQRPGPDAQAVLGDPGHRWLTGLGSIAGNSAEIELLSTAGGQFDAASPGLSRSVIGTLRLEFDSCTHGRAIYEFDNPLLSDVINLRRPFEDAQGIAFCEKFQRGPGKAGPL